MEEKKQQNIGREMYEWVQALVCSVLAVVILFTAGGTILLGFLLQAAYDFWKAGKNKNE